MRLKISRTSPIADMESVSIFLSREYGTVDRCALETVIILPLQLKQK
jgi:hypothetical protein